MSEKDESKNKDNYGLGRVLALTDGVFAIAATLLVVDLFVPTLSAGATSADLWNALAGEFHIFLAYLLSFFILGVWWTAHHRHYAFIRRSDSTLQWLNLFLLLWIGLLPFFTKILAEYGPLQIAVALYALDQGAAGLCVMLSWVYASRKRRLVDENLPDDTIRLTLMRSAIAPVIFFVSIGVSFVNPYAAYASWIVLTPSFVVVSHLGHKRKKEKLKRELREKWVGC
jgi:uncharacterized membrane protein